MELRSRSDRKRGLYLLSLGESNISEPGIWHDIFQTNHFFQRQIFVYVIIYL